AQVTIACRPDPHRRLTVTAGVDLSSPPSSAATRARYMSRGSVLMTWPKATWCTSVGPTPARAAASRTTMAPSCVGVWSLRVPPKVPTAVRTPLTMTTSLLMACSVDVLAPGRRGCPVRVGADGRPQWTWGESAGATARRPRKTVCIARRVPRLTISWSIECTPSARMSRVTLAPAAARRRGMRGRDQAVVRAVHEMDRGIDPPPRPDGPRQACRIGDHDRRGGARLAPERLERHRRALAEADQHRRLGPDVLLGLDEGEPRPELLDRGIDPLRATFQRPLGEPLAGAATGGTAGVHQDAHRARELQLPGDADWRELLGAGAPSMQEDDQPAACGRIDGGQLDPDLVVPHE